VPSFLTNVVAIAAGRSFIGGHNLALRRDGTVVGWGYNAYGQATPPANLSNVVAIAAGGLHSLALKSDGSIVAWGQTASGQATVPASISNAVAIAAGNNHSVALIGAAAGVYKPVLLAPAAAVCVQDRPWKLLVGAKNFPANFSAGGLPPGLTIDPVTGLISGIPALAGVFTVNLTAINALGATQATLSLTVISPNPRIYSRASAVAYTGNDVGFQILANNQPTSFAASGLPPGTSVDPITGVILGQPTAVGLFPATLSASNAYGIGTAPFTLDVRSVAAFGNNGSGQTNVPAGLSNVLAVVGGGSDTYALKADGRVVAWGYNGNTQTNVPAAVSNVVDIAGGGSHALALRSDGTVVGWGYNGYGQTTAPLGLSNVVSVAAGMNHSLALKSDGTVAGWGDNTYGQAHVPPELGSVVAVAAGDSHSLAVKAGGTVMAWGYNNNGQATVPPWVTNVVAVAGGGYHSLALRSDGTVVAWGWNIYGQTNVPAGLSNVVAVAAGQHHSVAQQANGNIVTWGLNTDGQGDPPDNLTNAVTVSAGKIHSVALSAVEPGVTGPVILTRKGMVGVMDKPFANRVIAKNQPTYFAAPGLPPGLSIDPATGRIFGTPSTDGTFPVTLVVGNASGTNQVAITVYIIRPIPRIYSPTSLVAYTGNDFDYQILADNSPVSYSVNGLPPGLGGDTLTGDITGQPGSVGLFSVALQAFNSYGTGSATLQLEIRTVAAWGSNNRGQTNPPVGLSNIVAIAAGGDTSYALRGDGRVVSWGDGVGYSQTNVPAGLSNVVGIAAGLYHVLALKANGTVTGWGYNGYQQANSPAGLSNVVGLACGYYHSLALRADGTVTAWGYNVNGQTNVPPGLSNVVQVAAGGYYSMALRDDGTVRVWGIYTNIPAGLSNVVAIAGGDTAQLALKADGTVVPWNGVTGVPAGFSNVVAIAAGGGFDLALRADGSVVGWGADSFGQLNMPPGLTRVVAIEAGGSHTLALPVVPRPQLRIDRNAPNVTVSWPLSLSAFALQSSGTLASSGWTNLFAFPSVSGNSNYFTFPLSSGQRYFRLRRM
jgi:alpha-tubulin suppressor-like RCC1 family protein